MSGRHTPGSRWRILATYPGTTYPGETGRFGGGPLALDFMHPRSNQPVFDELVVDRWVHMEQMSDGEWWMNVGGVTLWVSVGAGGEASGVHVFGPDQYAEAVPGCTYELTWDAGVEL